MDFDELAAGWDTSRRIERAEIIASEIECSVRFHNTDVALEFGCGTGLISLNLRDKFREIDMVDSSHKMIAQLKEKIGETNLSHLYPLVMDISSNPSFDRTYDVIYSSMVLHHIADVEAVIKKLHDLLSPGGRMCLVDLNPVSAAFHKQEKDFVGHHGFDPSTLKDILMQHAFSNVGIKTFYTSEKHIEDEIVPYSLFSISAYKS